MAEVLFKQEVVRRGEAGQWQIQSAGTWTEPGLPATQFSQVVMARRQIDLAEHRSQPVDGDLLRAADVILVMTHNHREVFAGRVSRHCCRGRLFAEPAD